MLSTVSFYSLSWKRNWKPQHRLRFWMIENNIISITNQDLFCITWTRKRQKGIVCCSHSHVVGEWRKTFTGTITATYLTAIGIDWNIENFRMFNALGRFGSQSINTHYKITKNWNRFFSVSQCAINWI